MSVWLPPFQAFLDEHREHVYRFIVASVGAQDAEDCFQETLLSALRAYPKLRSNDNLRGWVLTIAHRKALDCHRARAKRPVPVGDLPEQAATANGFGGESELWSSVRDLPEKQRAAVVLRFANDLAHREIGLVLGCSEEAARRNVHEGVKTLREALREGMSDGWQA
jgi:RNA polymerase sigma factor (sigma-70 family)